uniref:Cyclin-dependent kinase inhibitor domain-containing protein n=1 Tax=Leptobrachium leishanense TaxID=445787 RepID=A0A8C5QYU3_9ANUR
IGGLCPTCGLAGRLPGFLSGSRACRSLFGPVDHVELRQELQLRLREIQEESCRRWSFDFQQGVPLSGAWEEAAGDNMPDFYRDKDCEERPGPPEGHMPCLEGNEAPQEEEEPPNTALTREVKSQNIQTRKILPFISLSKSAILT